MIKQEETQIIPQRGEICWLNFNPTVGSEIYKIKPALILAVPESRIITLQITSNIKETKRRQLIIKKLTKGKDGKLLL